MEAVDCNVMLLPGKDISFTKIAFALQRMLSNYILYSKEVVALCVLTAGMHFKWDAAQLPL